jgi:hypothetical protein
MATSAQTIFGETAQKLRMIFDSARTTRGIYLFDEIDALAASRGTENDVGETRRILNSFLPAGEGRPAHLGGNHQGTMDLRAGSSATERRTRSRSL